MLTWHPDYGTLASRIEASNLQKETTKSLKTVVNTLWSHQMVSDELLKIVEENQEKLESALVFARDFKYDYFGIKTLQKSYLLKLSGKIVERPQHMLMRVALGIHGDDIDAAIETYELMSTKAFTPAS